MSNTVGNGRYMTATNLVAKCIGGPDLDHDGYCAGAATDNFDANTGHNAGTLAWAPTHPPAPHRLHGHSSPGPADGH